MEADIRKHQETLDRSGVLIQNKQGTLVANPLLAVIDTLERRQMAVIRSISLNPTPKCNNYCGMRADGAMDEIIEY
jgi:phage terminase small subunit